jgi:hypothetical protein
VGTSEARSRRRSESAPRRRPDHRHRAASTVSREVTRHGGSPAYCAHDAVLRDSPDCLLAVRIFAHRQWGSRVSRDVGARRAPLCADERAISFAMAATSRTIAFARLSILRALSRNRSASRRPPALLPAAYLPLNHPPASGDHAVTPRLRAFAIGTSSGSTVCSIRLYSTYSPANRVHPRNSASVLACAIHHAGASETPAYRIFPCRTRSSKPRMTSSTGVIASQMWSQ